MEQFTGSRFTLKEYIDKTTVIKQGLSSPTRTTFGAFPQTFEPKPLIRTFESSLDELLRLRRKVQTKIDDLEDAAQASEHARRKKRAELTAAVEDVQTAFQSLETHLAEVGKTAIRIGEQLETIDKQRRRAKQARDLIEFYLDFNKETPPKLEEFRKINSETEAEAKFNIEKYCEELERNVLEEFNEAYTKNDRISMKIQNMLERLLENSGNLSELNYLRVLESVHASTSALIADLQKFNKEFITSKVDEFGLTIVIERSFDDLFVPYTSGDRYIELERSCLKRQLEETLEVFTNYMNSRKRLKAKNMKFPPVGSIIPAQPQSSGIPSMQAMGQFLNMGFGADASKTTSSLPPETTPEEVGCPSVDMALQLLEIHVESLNRCVELTKPVDLARNGATLFRVFVETIGPSYLLAVLDMVIEDITLADTRAEPDLAYFDVVQTMTRILHLIQLHFQTSVIPLLSHTPTIHREMVIAKNDFMARVEAQINLIFQKHLDASHSWLLSVIAKHKKTDFRPKEDRGSTATIVTTTVGKPTNSFQRLTCVNQIPCNQSCDFLLKLFGRAAKYLSPSNLESFMGEIGSLFHMSLLDHIKKFTYNETGGMILMKDLEKYYDTIACFDLPSLKERFDILREIGRVITYKSESLQNLLNEGHLNKIDFNLIQPFLAARTDWTKIQKNDLFGPGRMK
ncbi:Exocyst complex component 5 [Blyttiomyces sp. JEL0837]|nr:Exocyst complex component 5 [Blyttiomyces sp. JEL0837]